MAQDAIINRWNINGDVYDIQDAGRGRPLGVATLDENGRVPYTQLPESAVEFKGYWNASTNTPTLHDGTGTKGDLYYVDVAGTQDLGSGSQVFEIGDRVLYDGSVWKNMKSGGTDIEVYPTMADLEQDLPNLEDGTLVATEEGDAFTTVDTVQSGVFNPVTSNAVAQEIEPLKNPANTVCVGSFLLWRGSTTLNPSTTQNILGAYNYILFDFMPSAPQGWHKEYNIAASVTSNNSVKVRVRLNNIATGYGGTWSSDTFRTVVYSPLFKTSDITLETTFNYSSPGTNLKFQTDNGSGIAIVYSVTINAFYVKD